MVTLKETSELVLKNIYADNTINTKEYTNIDALLELKSSIEYLIKKAELQSGE